MQALQASKNNIEEPSKVQQSQWLNNPKHPHPVLITPDRNPNRQHPLPPATHPRPALTTPLPPAHHDLQRITVFPLQQA